MYDATNISDENEKPNNLVNREACKTMLVKAE